MRTSRNICYKLKKKIVASVDRTYGLISLDSSKVSIYFTYTVPPDTAQVYNRSELQSGLDQS